MLFHGDLDEDIYMKPPPGLELPSPGLVLQIAKILVWLKTGIQTMVCQIIRHLENSWISTF